MSEPRRLWALTLVAVGLLAVVVTQGSFRPWSWAPSAAPRPGERPFVGRVVNFGDVVYEGPIDLGPTLERIAANRSLPGRADGGVYRNRDRALPEQADPDYYREYVHWDAALASRFPGRITFPGPQRVVVGKGGEVFYSGDHYATWSRLR